MASASIPRARPPPVEKRESVLRASILDTALELGIGTSSTVASWMFNSVNEAEEEIESTLSPSLTYASTATSEDSLLSPSRPARSGAGSQLNPSHKVSAGEGLQYSQRDGLTTTSSPAEPTQRTIQFDLSTTPEPRAPSPFPPAAAKHNKLRKAKPDGYESDGGYVSDGTKSEKEKKRWRKEKKEKEKPRARGSDDESDGGYLSDILHKRRNKKKKEKAKTVDSPATDYETDAGYKSSSSLGRKKKDKKSKTSGSTAGDESDGGNLSESSTKKKRFFRLNGRSSRRREDSDAAVREVIPPVPSLPPLALPIAERFARSETPSVSDSRAMTPALSEQTVTQRSSDDVSFMDTTSSISTPLDSPRGLTKAFRDAESIRTPSTDVLRAFGRQVGLAALRSPTKDTPHARGDSDMSSSVSSLQSIPMLGMPKPRRNPSQKRTPVQISAPNTQALSVKPQPIPMTLTPPTPHAGISPLRLSPRSPNPETGSMVIVAGPGTPTSSIYDTVPHSPSNTADFSTQSPLPSPGLPTGSSATLAATASRAHLAKYDLPPPSPPPVGPLPLPPSHSVPSLDLGTRKMRSSLSRPGSGDNERRPPPSPLSKSSTDNPVHPDSAPVRAPPSPYRPHAGSLNSSMPPPTSAPAVIRSESGPSTAPLFLRRIPSIQRGRESPFPERPVFPRSGSSPTVSSAAPQRPEIRVSSDRGGDASRFDDAGYYQGGGPQQQLDTRWHTHTSSTATSAHRNSDPEDEDDGEKRSWVDFGSSNGSSRRSSLESRPDVESVLSALQDGHDAIDEDDVAGLYAQRSGDEFDDDDRSRYPDEEMSLAGRSTKYFDADGNSDEGGDRYSMWSEADRRSRASIIDGERSSESREKLMKRVAEMYSKEGIARGLVPPVPALPLSSKKV